jgi:MarR family transcriptional regulator, transcriptional regulator for hemolysin
MIFREIFREFLLISRPIANELDAVLASFDLTLSHWKVISFMERSGTCTLVEISRHLSTRKPFVTRMIHHLEQKRLVERISGKDKREKRTKLTHSGEEVYAVCRNTLDEIEFDLLNSISDEEQKILLHALSAIGDNVKQVMF